MRLCGTQDVSSPPGRSRGRGWPRPVLIPSRSTRPAVGHCRSGKFSEGFSTPSKDFQLPSRQSGLGSAESISSSPDMVPGVRGFARSSSLRPPLSTCRNPAQSCQRGQVQRRGVCNVAADQTDLLARLRPGESSGEILRSPMVLDGSLYGLTAADRVPEELLLPAETERVVRC